MRIPVARMLAAVAAAMAVSLAGSAEAQVVVYEAYRPVVAAPFFPAPAYVANYTPAGNYAAVTAFSPPVFGPSAAVSVSASFAPGPVAVTSYFAPVVPTVPVVAPVTTYYAPAPVVAPLYRRGPFGRLRPVRAGYFLPY